MRLFPFTFLIEYKNNFLMNRQVSIRWNQLKDKQTGDKTSPFSPPCEYFIYSFVDVLKIFKQSYVSAYLMISSGRHVDDFISETGLLFRS